MAQRDRISINCTPEMTKKLKEYLSRGIRQEVLNSLCEALFEGMDKFGREEVIGQALRGKLVIGFKQ